MISTESQMTWSMKWTTSPPKDAFIRSPKESPATMAARTSHTSLALVSWNACACHQEPTSGKLCLSIAAIGSQFIPEHALLQVLLYAVAIPIGSSAILL